MRLRSVITVFAMTGLLGAGILRCKLPPEPPGPQALQTRAGFVHSAFVAVPASASDGGATLDEAALVASLKELDVTTVFLGAAADDRGAFVDERVALAIALQRDLGPDSAVFVGTYRSEARNGKPMDQLLQADPTFTSCYPSGGPKLDANAALIDKLRVCSQDVSQKIAASMKAKGANDHIGCTIAQETELVDTLSDDAKAKLAALFHDSASACADAGRLVAISPLLTTLPSDPDRAGVLLRETLQDSGVSLVSLHDGVGSVDPTRPSRAAAYFQGLRNAIADRQPTVLVWANVEAFDCETPACTKTHPTTRQRYLEQLCFTRGRVDGIASSEYVQDLGGRSLAVALDASSGLDGSAELAALAADLDASAQLRTSYLTWRDAGGPCPPPLDAGR